MITSITDVMESPSLSGLRHRPNDLPWIAAAGLYIYIVFLIFFAIVTESEICFMSQFRLGFGILADCFTMAATACCSRTSTV